MSNGFAVEVDRKVVGIAVRVPGGFKFFSSSPEFSPLESRVFKRVRSISRRLAEFARARSAGRNADRSSARL